MPVVGDQRLFDEVLRRIEGLDLQQLLEVLLQGGSWPGVLPESAIRGACACASWRRGAGLPRRALLDRLRVRLGELAPRCARMLLGRASRRAVGHGSSLPVAHAGGCPPIQRPRNSGARKIVHSGSSGWLGPKRTIAPPANMPRMPIVRVSRPARIALRETMHRAEREGEQAEQLDRVADALAGRALAHRVDRARAGEDVVVEAAAGRGRRRAMPTPAMTTPPTRGRGQGEARRAAGGARACSGPRKRQGEADAEEAEREHEDAQQRRRRCGPACTRSRRRGRSAARRSGPPSRGCAASPAAARTGWSRVAMPASTRPPIMSRPERERDGRGARALPAPPRRAGLDRRAPSRHRPGA